MEKWQITGDNIAAVARACAEFLRSPGAVIAVPTETVYGLVCRWDDDLARENIYKLKHRDKNKLLAMFAPTSSVAAQYGAVINQSAQKLFDSFTPGAITIIVSLSPGGTLGVRIPDHPFIAELMRATGFPLASTSANLSGSPAALSATAAVDGLSGSPSGVVDGGVLPPESLASPVVDVSTGEVKILREGAISAAEIFRCVATD